MIAELQILAGRVNLLKIYGKHGLDKANNQTSLFEDTVDENNDFENFANPSSIIWQQVETDFWKNFLKESIKDFENKTYSQKAKKILDNFDTELKKFKQVCPVEMLDKLDNPISLKPHIKRAG